MIEYLLYEHLEPIGRAKLIGSRSGGARTAGKKRRVGPISSWGVPKHVTVGDLVPGSDDESRFVQLGLLYKH